MQKVQWTQSHHLVHALHARTLGSHVLAVLRLDTLVIQGFTLLREHDEEPIRPSNIDVSSFVVSGKKDKPEPWRPSDSSAGRQIRRASGAALSQAWWKHLASAAAAELHRGSVIRSVTPTDAHTHTSALALNAT